jgi:pimeloyl-ACP methyl ester carboxylesterase
MDATWTTVPSTDGVALAVHHLGGTGPPLLLLHATGFCGLAYRALGAALTGRFAVHALDFRGHGDSGRPDGARFEWGGMADDLLAVVDALDGAPFRLFGHSLGGAVALLAAGRRPRAFAGAYLYEPIVLPDALDGPDPTAIADSALRRRPGFSSREEAFWRYARRPPLDTLQAGVLADYVEHGLADLPDGTVRLKCLPADEAATFGAGGKPTVGTVADLALPVVVAAGAEEAAWTPARLAPAVAVALPGARFERHPTLGHLGPLENPAAVARHVLAAFDGRDVPDGSG